ncbi:aspartate aminotransferase family protein [Bacteroidota bacterium]|nr:aspartate aminotransferase family protein [Bacteroidota bacterium]
MRLYLAGMLTERQLFLNLVAQTSTAPMMLEPERAEGIYVYDKNGNRYLDLIAGISVGNLGHRHPRVVDAIKKQADKYLHLMVYGEYVQSPQVQLAQLLTHHLPPHLDTVYFTNSGAEATEGAMKLAKRYTGKFEIVCFNKSYHGSTQGALSLMGDEYFRNSFRPLLPGITHVDYNDIHSLNVITDKTACVILEPVQAESGVIVPDISFLKHLQKKCEQHKALLIFDEAQTGMGRTGELFAFQKFGVTPDILLTAKALGGGLPLGAFISSNEIMSSLTHEPVLGHLTTFGGNPLSCAAGLAALQALLEEGWMKQVEEKEKLFHKLLQHPRVKMIRSCGLLMAIEFESDAFNKRVIEECWKYELITDWFLFAPNCLRIAPPLIITEEEIEAACRIILQAVEIAASEIKSL